MSIDRRRATAAKTYVATQLAGHDAAVGLHVDHDGSYAVRVNVAADVVAQAVRTLIGDEVDGVPVHIRVVGQVGLRGMPG